MKELAYPDTAIVNGGLSTLQTVALIPAAVGFYVIRQLMMDRECTVEGGIISLASGALLAAGIWMQDA